jgi:hypothetical protein
VGNYADWRLPTLIDTGTPGCNYAAAGTDCGYNVQTRGDAGTVYSELAHLYFVALGNKSIYSSDGSAQSGAGLTNTANFEDLQSFDYWTGKEVAPGSPDAWYFYTVDGAQLITDKSAKQYALIVRDGDVSPVPEAQTPLMLVCGIGMLGFLRRRQR